MLLEAREITKRFAGTIALDAVSIEIERGERVGLIGPNGAGKTTYFNCILGLLRPDGGRVLFADRDVTAWRPYRRAKLGLGRTFQRIELFVGLTVRQHLLVATRVRQGNGSLWRDLTNRAAPSADERAAIDHILALLQLDTVADRPIETLTLGQCRLVEVGRALMGANELLLLDEPSSGLDRRETDALTAVLSDVQVDRGLSILLVEHDVAMVRSFVDRLYVLDAGRLIASGETHQVLSDDAVRTAYLGSGQ
jgi:branched-chain amino acid transport system ATP-binding protein